MLTSNLLCNVEPRVLRLIYYSSVLHSEQLHCRLAASLSLALRVFLLHPSLLQASITVSL